LRPASCNGPLTATADGVRIAIRLTPRAKADRLAGIVCGADGAPALQVYVAAPPVDDRANDALLRLLARTWRLPRRDLAITAGAGSRSKTVHIAGDPERLLPQLAATLAQTGKATAPNAP
jgi:uncharacterized protein